MCDPQKNFLLVKEQRDLIASAGKVIWGTGFEVVGSKRYDGLYLPLQIETHTFFRDNQEQGTGKKITVDEISIGKLKERDLVVVFPKGIKVFDKIKGIEYFEGDAIPGDPSSRSIYVRYSLMILGIIFILLGISRKIYEMKRNSRK
jgi:hypothetical protein